LETGETVDPTPTADDRQRLHDHLRVLVFATANDLAVSERARARLRTRLMSRLQVDSEFGVAAGALFALGYFLGRHAGELAEQAAPLPGDELVN
jgi:hypothetical protein